MIEVNTETKYTHSLKNNDIEFIFLKTGDIKKAHANGVMLNQVLGNTIDGSMNNLYLRLHEKGSISYTPLLGIQSPSTFAVGDQRMKWQGTFKGIDYTVTFQIGESNAWFWTVDVEGDDKVIDIVYGWDLGLHYQGALQSNEGYVAQYVGHSVFNEENGYVVCSRQNQSADKFQYMQQGGLTDVVGYSTDGFQFYGKEYKETNEIEQLKKETLANKVYQYEFDYTALQSDKIALNGSHRFVFYGLYRDNHPEGIKEHEYKEEIKKSFESLTKETDTKQLPKVSLNDSLGEPLSVESMTIEELNEYYPNRIQEEKADDEMLSFFTEDYSHVALKEKEVGLERQHGHIIYSKNELTVDEPIMATTSWMAGVFNSQIVLGNSSMNKFLTNTRNHLNVLKTQGQRIYVKIDDQYHLLTMPSVFEMGFNYAKWIYKTTEDTFVVTNITHSRSDSLKLTIETASGKSYAYKVTNQIALHEQEYTVPYCYKQDGNMITFKPGENSVSRSTYPELTYYMSIEGPKVTCSDGSSLTNKNDEATSSLFVVDIPETNTFSLIIQGTITGEEYTEEAFDFKHEKEAFQNYYASLTNQLSLDHPSEKVKSEVEKMNIVLWWYTHDMFVHYLSPHGLEQYGGAAWGTRDVAQGPAEYFLAMRRYDVVRKIIIKLYSHQFIEDGNWPQWFMFDNYEHIHSDESHGDIIVWPMKLLGDYLTATGDYSILNEKAPYLSLETHRSTDEEDTLLDHLNKELSYIKANFLDGTALSSYGDGDWDDTLQPNNQKLKKHMVSSWTVALTYQALNNLAEGIQKSDSEFNKELKDLAEKIKRDYDKYIMSDKVIPGFLYMEKEQIDFMIHPKDTKTGITYRLLPMIRSMISELFDEEQVETHLDIIKNELTFNDGIRLMNRPATYKGGVSTNFKRAEQAANFGREIGLLYIHAHIRYIEAMAKLGKGDETWKNLLKINPVNIRDHVENAQRRQSNAYFSSSDAAFDDRYEAQNNYDKLRRGEVEVKGGWRVYSSGPGIYLNQMIGNVLGRRETEKQLIIDPVLPEELDGLKVSMTLYGKPVTFTYNAETDKKDSTITINNKKVAAEQSENKYRAEGIIIEKQKFQDMLDENENNILIKY